MMDGEKMNAFILDLSFIRMEDSLFHHLRSCRSLLCDPYEYATDAELFLVLKQNYFSGHSYSNTYHLLNGIKKSGASLLGNT